MVFPLYFIAFIQFNPLFHYSVSNAQTTVYKLVNVRGLMLVSIIQALFYCLTLLTLSDL